LVSGGSGVLGKVSDDSLCIEVDRHVFPGHCIDRVGSPEAFEPVGLSVSIEGVGERRAKDDLQLGERVGPLPFGGTKREVQIDRIDGGRKRSYIQSFGADQRIVPGTALQEVIFGRLIGIALGRAQLIEITTVPTSEDGVVPLLAEQEIEAGGAREVVGEPGSLDAADLLEHVLSVRPARRAPTQIDRHPSGGVEVGGEHEFVRPDQVIVTGPPND